MRTDAAFIRTLNSHRTRPVISRATLVAAAILSTCVAVGRAEDRLPDSERSTARDNLTALLDRALTGHGQSKARFGGRVVSLPSGDVVYDSGGRSPLIPASNMKLVVMATAIDHLGPNYEFRTVCAVRGQDLVVLGGGDPTLGDDRLAAERKEPITAVFRDWAQRLKSSGVKQIPGNIVIDDSLFDRQFTHPNWPPEQHETWYEAPVGALNFADNCVEISVKPGKSGKPATVSMVPGNTALKIINKTSTGSKQTVSAHRRRGSDEVVVTGSVARAGTLGPISVNDPGLYFGGVLRTVLAAQGIRVGGSVVRQAVPRDANGNPTGAHVIAVVKTPLRDALARAGKQSLGMMAEALIKLLGSRQSGIGSWESGRAVVMSFLQKVGADTADCKVDDGSGLSRLNRISPLAMTRVLQYMNTASPEKFALLRDCLAVAGVDGTLEKRMRDPATKGRVFAKTGYINGVRTLAGYIRTGPDSWLAFAFFYNQAAATRPLSDAQDKACKLLAGGGSPRP